MKRKRELYIRNLILQTFFLKELILKRMSDNESEAGETSGIIFNVTYYDSSDEESEDFEDLSSSDEEDYGEMDELTEKKMKVLKERLDEVADVVPIGKSFFKVSFFNKKDVELVLEEVCEFDYDKRGIPIMVDGGESYLIPYLKELCIKKKFLKPFTIKTNLDKEKYYF